MSANPSLRDEVATKLRNEILSGQYRAGERLPSERDLAERFGVNRGCVREALKTLEQLGLADIRKGGARVLPLREASLDVLGPLLELQELPDPELVDQLFEVLEPLIGVAVRRTVERASESDLERARELVEEIAEARAQDDYQMAVHQLIKLFVEASGNLVLRLAGKGLRTTQFMGRLHSTGVDAGPPHDLFAGVARRLGQALAKRDPQAATETMQRLMRLSREHALKRLEERRASANGASARSMQ